MRADFSRNSVLVLAFIVSAAQRGGPWVQAAIPLVINTWDFRQANQAAWTELVERGSSAVDAVVAGCGACERLQCDGTVGFGGSPDENGETTLDALLMDGRTMNVGAVAALRHIRDASAVARCVLENTAHSLLAGSQATEFAERMGFRRQSLVTPQSALIWNRWEADDCQPNFWRNVHPDPRTQCGPYEPLRANAVGGGGEGRWRNGSSRMNEFGRLNHDTIGIIVIDGDLNVASGTSTNGANHKIPGRVGDSPIAGSGAYSDNTVGAAAATGDGDILMRFLPSLLAVEFMRGNISPNVAARLALERIRPYYPGFVGAIIAANRQGVYGAACHGMATFPYSVYNAASGPVLETVVCIN